MFSVCVGCVWCVNLGAHERGVRGPVVHSEDVQRGQGRRAGDAARTLRADAVVEGATNVIGRAYHHGCRDHRVGDTSERIDV